MKRELRTSCLLLLAVLICCAAICFTASAQSPSTASAARVLHFPNDRSLGTVSVLDENYVEKIEPYFYSPNFTQWEKLGRAQGDVIVPPGKKVKLTLGRDAARDLSPLAMLGPNDLDALEWGGCLVEPSDQAIGHIARLTGLKELNIAAGMLRTNGTDPCPLSIASFSKLRAMPSLVSLKTPYHMTNEQFAALSGMTRLKRLDVQSNRFTDRGLAPLATMTGLEQLAVGGERLTDAGLYYIAGLPRLTHLRLWGRGFHDGALAHIKNIRTLKSLSIFWHQITNAGFAQISGMTQLEQLDAGYTKITDAGLAHLKPLRNLKTLGLGDTMITDDGLVHIKDLTSLEVLGLNGGSQNYGKGVTGRGLPHLANLKNLKSLTINSPRSSPIGDADIKNLLGFSRLEELHLWGPCNVTDQGMADLAKLSNLKNLNLGLDAPRITNRGLAELAKLSRLERLELGGANGITISGLNALNGLTTLKVLNAGYCFKWNIDGDKPLDISGLKNLEELSLTSARDEDLACLAGLTKLNELLIRFQARLSPGNTLSDRGLQHLAGLTSMKKLSIGGPGVTDAGLSNFARMNKLEYLSLQGYFTSAGLPQLQQFKNLWSINIKSGSSLSPSAIQHLRASLPEIQYFEVAGDKKLPKGKSMTTSNTLVEPTIRNGHPQVGVPAPDFTAPTLDGKEFKLSEQRGKVVVLHFWATWCAPCIKSAPALKKLQDQLKAQFGDRFVWVDLSLDDYERNVLEHVKKYDLKSVQVRIGQLSRIAADYGVKGGVPDDFMIGPDGKILLNRESPQVDTATAIAKALQ